MQNKSSLNVVFLGDSGFPLGLAAIQRITLMSKALMFQGCNVIVVCCKGVWKKDVKTNLGRTGIYEGIPYHYTSENVFRPKGFIKRNFLKVKGIFGEYAYLKKLKKQGKLDVAILSTMTVTDAIRYRIISLLVGFPIVLNLVEMASSIENRTFFLTRLNDYIFDRLVIKWFQGAMPISDKLVDYYNGITHGKPCMKVPVICNFDLFEHVDKENAEPYFLYCGSAGFLQVAEFVLESYRPISKKSKMKLVMIVSGNKSAKIALLKEKIKTMFGDGQVKLFSNIPYDKLVGLFTNAKALLIPLRPTLQDTARFPHKIGEYLATGNPIITTDVGEIKNYFENEKTALIAQKYTTEAFTQSMGFVLENPKKSKKVGMQGKQLGLKEFHYKSHGERMYLFLDQFKRTG